MFGRCILRHPLRPPSHRGRMAMAAMLTMLAMAAGGPPPPGGAAATRSIMCPCDTTSQKQQWNISSLGNASFVTNLLAVSEGLDACLAVFSDQDPRHPVEGNAATMFGCAVPRTQPTGPVPLAQRQWVVKPETQQLVWASPETGGARKGEALCLTAFPASEAGVQAASDPSPPPPPPPPPPLGVWPCSQRNSTRFPDWQTFVPTVGRDAPYFVVVSPGWGGLCVSWAGTDDSC